MFQALLAHLQEVLHKQQLVYCMWIMPGQQPVAVYAGPPEDEQVVLETCRGC
jgi:hypothetical protein